MGSFFKSWHICSQQTNRCLECKHSRLFLDYPIHRYLWNSNPWYLRIDWDSLPYILASRNFEQILEYFLSVPIRHWSKISTILVLFFLFSINLKALQFHFIALKKSEILDTFGQFLIRLIRDYIRLEKLSIHWLRL